MRLTRLVAAPGWKPRVWGRGVSTLKEGRWCSWVRPGVPRRALWFSQVFSSCHGGHPGRGLVCIQYPLDENVDAVWVFCPAQSPQGNARLACKSHTPKHLCLLYRWLPSVLYTFSAQTLWHSDGNFQSPLNGHIRGSPNLLCSVMFATWCVFFAVLGGKITHFYLFMYLFFLFRNWPLVTGVQGEERCGFLAVNIWPRTERTCGRSKVRDLLFCHRR